MFDSPDGAPTGSKSTESDSNHGREYPESGKGRKRSHVTDFVTEKKNRVASSSTSRQKSWKSHAILKVEAPGVERDRKPCKSKGIGPNGRNDDVTRSAQIRSQPVSGDEFVTTVTRARKQISKARKAFDTGDKAVADEVLAKLDRQLERMMRRLNATSK